MSPRRKRGPGRPRLPKDALRGSVLSMRLTQAERWAIERKAAETGLSAADWARAVVVAALGSGLV